MLPDACLSAVNLCEVLGRFARDGHDPHAVARRLLRLGIEVVPFTDDHAAGRRLAAAYRSFGAVALGSGLPGARPGSWHPGHDR